MATREIVVNMVPGGVTPVIHVSQYDDGYGITANLIENSGTYTVPTGATVSIEGTKPDGHGYAYLCTYQDNAVVIPVNTQMTAVKGKHPCELVVRKDGLRVGSKNMIMAVEVAGLGEDTIISDTELPAIIALAQEQEEAAASSASQAAASAIQAASSAASAETAKTAAMDAAEDAIDAAQELQTAIQFNAALIHETASGAVASFADGADNIPMQSVVAEITPVQSGSGDPSPDNIRPISGRTGLTLTHSGKNLLPMPITSGSYANATTVTVNDDKSFYISKTSGSGWTTFELGTFTLPAGTYTLIESDDGNENASVSLYSSSGEIVNTRYTKLKTFTLNEATTITRATFSRSAAASNILTKLMLFVGSTATAADYKPYNATVYPITWESIAGTVYGGTLDVVSGVLTVDREYIQFTADKWTIWNNTDKAAFTNAEYSGQTVTMCDSLVPNSTGLYVRLADGRVRAIAPWAASCTSLAEFKTALANNPPINAVLTLATPQTYQLTGAEVRTLLGGNTIYTDAGEVSVEYVADTKLYIDNKIAELQALVLEN